MFPAKNKSAPLRFPAVIALLATLTFWGLGIGLEHWFDLPELPLPNWLRWGLAILFLSDLLYLGGGGLVALRRHQWGRTLVTEGPYRFVRHPLYSALVYSCTGLLTVWQKSWLLLISVLPLSLVWSWIAGREDRILQDRFGRTYLEYRQRTGEFFPNFRNLAEEEN